MRNTIASTLLLIYLSTSFTACKDDEDTLPPITSSGKGTFGCRIDGDIFVPSNPRVEVTGDMISVLASRDRKSFVLTVRDTAKAIIPDMTYTFGEQKDIRPTYATSAGATYCFYEDSPISGYIKFSKIDYEKNIISGVFEFSSASTMCNASVIITEGRFDLPIPH